MRISAFCLIATLTLLFVNCATASASTGDNRPEVRSPAQGQQFGEQDDPQCELKRPCFKIRGVGWVPAQRVPFFAVAPVKASPRMWIQPLITDVNADGTFSGLLNLGEAHNGARQYFKIFVFACTSSDRFYDGQEIVALPDDCEVSAPVEVYRER